MQTPSSSDSVFQWKQKTSRHHNEDYRILSRVIDPSIATSLLSATRNNDGSLATWLLAILAILLKRYTNNESVIIAMPGLKEEQSNDNVVSVIFNIDETKDLKNFLRYTGTQLKDAYSSQHVPMQTEQKNFLPTNVLLSVDTLHTSLPSIAVYDFILQVHKRNGDLLLDFQFAAAVYEEWYARQFVDHFFVLLNMFQDGGRVISDCDILSAAEKTQLFEWGTGKKVRFAGQACVHRLFDEICQGSPEHTAVIFNGKEYDYAYIGRQSDLLASWLVHSAAVKPGQRIGVFMDRSEWLVISIIAILKSGGVYVPIDSANTRERRSFIIADSNTGLLLTESKFLFDLEDLPIQLFAVDIQLASVSCIIHLSPDRVQPDDAAYLIYTSGSTGGPKGVLIRHRSIFNTISWRNSFYAFANGDIILQIPSLGFDSSIEDFFCALTTGAALLIPEEDKRKDVVYLAGLIAAYKVTHFLITPALYNALLENNAGQPQSLRVVTVAGEAVNEALIEKHFRLMSNVKLTNEYGPAENSVCTTVAELTKGTDISIGRPIDNVFVYITDAEMRLVPAGVKGEILIGGAGLCDGYQSNDELNKKLFFDDPFNPGTILYRSGDYGEWFPDGNIRFLGRKDDQVKVNGIRVEPAEIESAIRKLYAVEDCAIVTVKNNNGVISFKCALKIDPLQEFTLHRWAVLAANAKDLAVRYHVFPNGLGIYYKNTAEIELIYHEIFEENSYLRHGLTLPENAVVFDVGANIGLFSLFCGLHFPASQIYSFEPLRPIYDLLVANLSLYGINVKPFNFGFSHFEGTAAFRFYINNTASSGIYADTGDERALAGTTLQNLSKYSSLNKAQIDQLVEEGLQYENHTVELRTLSSFIKEQQIGWIDLLKIDAEKSELDILRGLDRHDWARIQQIVAEVHDVADNITVLEDLLQLHNFSFVREQPVFLTNSNVFYYYAKQKTGHQHLVSLPAIHPELKRKSRLTDVKAYLDTIAEGCEKLLPAYMVPSAFKIVPAFPVTVNGKIDKNQLEKMFEQENAAGHKMAPSTDIEKLVKKIWSSVIGNEHIGINDNFFQVGGDSIKAIQIASRLYKEGYKTELKDIFEKRTIYELAKDLQPVKKLIDQSPVEGVIIPLTPIQKELFPVSRIAPGHFNQALILFSKEQIARDTLQKVIEKLQHHHDALRITLQIADGSWVQYNNGLRHPVAIAEYDGLSWIEMERTSKYLQQTIDLENGPLMKLGLFHCKDGDRLLIIIHHTIVDGISWRILLEDMETLFAQMKKNEELQLPPKTESFYKWSLGLREYAQSELLLKENDWWAKLESQRADILPYDFEPGNTDFTLGALNNISFILNEQDTRQLITTAHAAYNTEVNDILLAALSMTVSEIFGAKQVLIDLEGHGREKILPDIDISRTVGWFTTIYPILLNPPLTRNLEQLIIGTKEYLRSIPFHGIGYGILKHLSPRGNGIALKRKSQILFNYLGQFDEDFGNSSFDVSSDYAGHTTDQQNLIQHDISIVGLIEGKQLSVGIDYNSNLFSKQTISGMAAAYKQNLLALIDFCTHNTQRQLTQSDVTGKDISLHDMEAIKTAYNV